MAVDPVPIIPTRLSANSTRSCGHCPVWYHSPVKDFSPGMSGTLAVERQPTAVMSDFAMKVSPVDLSSASTALRIKMSVHACTPDRLEELKAVLAAHPGPSPVLLELANDRKTTLLRLGGGYTVEMRNGLYAELRSVGVEARV